MLPRNRPIVAIDIDGVMADYVHAVAGLANAQFGLDLDPSTDPQRYDMSDWLTTSQWSTVHDLWERFGVRATSVLDATSARTCFELSRRGFRVVALTSRAEVTRMATRRWLTENSIEVDDLVLVDRSEDKAEFACAVLVDDHPGVIAAACASDVIGQTICYDHAYNRPEDHAGIATAGRITRLDELLGFL